MWNWFSFLCVCNSRIALMFLPILLCSTEGISSTAFGLMKVIPSKNQHSQIMEFEGEQKITVNHIKKYKKPPALTARINETFSNTHPSVINEAARKWLSDIYQQDRKNTSNTPEDYIAHKYLYKDIKFPIKNDSIPGEILNQLKNPVFLNILSSNVHSKLHTLNKELPQEINIEKHSTVSNITTKSSQVELRSKRDLNNNFQRTYIVERPRQDQTEQQVPDLQHIMKIFPIPQTLKKTNLLLQKDSEVVFSIKRDTGKSKLLEQNIQETLKAFLRMAENKPPSSVNETRTFPSFLKYADVPIEKGILGYDNRKLPESDMSMMSRNENADSLQYGKHYFVGLQSNQYKPQSSFGLESQHDGKNLNFPTNAILNKLYSNKSSLKMQNPNTLPYSKHILGYATDIIFHKLNYENLPYSEHNADKSPSTDKLLNQNPNNLRYKEQFKNFMEGNSRKQNFENVPYSEHVIDDVPIPENILQQNLNFQSDRENFIRTTERNSQEENYENLQDTLINGGNFLYGKLNANSLESRIFNQQKHHKFPNVNQNKLYSANNHQYIPYFTANDQTLSYRPIAPDFKDEEHKTYMINANNPDYSDNNSKVSSQILSSFTTVVILSDWQFENEPTTVHYSGKLNIEYELQNMQDYDEMASRISSKTNINSFTENDSIGNEAAFYAHVTNENPINKTQSTWSVDPNLLSEVAKSTDIYNLTAEILDTFIPVTFNTSDLKPYEEGHGPVWKPLLRNKEKYLKEEMHIGKQPTAKASEIIRNGNHLSSDFVEYVRRKKTIDSHQPMMEGRRVLTRRRRQIDVDKSGNVFFSGNPIDSENQIQNVAFSDCCYNGGTCHTAKTVHGKTSQWCFCPSTFTGLYCEIRVNECLSKPCKENRICINFPKGYSCVCAPGFIKEADDCIPQITCAEFPCLNGGLCEDTKDNLFKCTCPLGFLGRTCEIRVPECEDSSCSGNEICISTETGYRCMKKQEVQS